MLYHQIHTMGFNTIRAIIGNNWLIERQWAVNSMPLIARMLRGEEVNFFAESNFRPSAYSDDDDSDGRAPKHCMTLTPTGDTYKAGRWSSFKDAPKNSIALIPVVGPILKYGGDCGEPGSIHINQWVKDASEASNIVGAIFKFDTPGGQVDGTATLADSIKNFGKPNAGFIDDGMMASAGMWLGSACDNIYASQPTDSAGSIGVLTNFYTFEEYLKKEGIKLHEIYAPQSTDKNKDYRDAIKGDYALIEGDLKFICDQFISTISENRKGKLNLKAGNPFTGKMFFAKEATDIGLIDGIKSFDEVINDISSRASGSSSGHSAQTNSTQNIMLGFETTKLVALKGKEAKDITAEEIDAVNTQLSENKIALTLSTEAVIQEKINTATTDLTKKVSDLEVELTAVKSDAKTKTDRIAELEAMAPDAGNSIRKDDKDASDKTIDPKAEFRTEHDDRAKEYNS